MPEIGQNLAHYSIVEKIGKGGMGEAWKALDTLPDRIMAIKKRKWIMAPKFTLVLSLLVAFSASAFGQSIQGYGFFALGQKRTDDESVFNMHFGVGARFVHFVGGGFGFEAGMAGPRNNFKKMSAGAVSANYYYDLIRGEDPHHYHGNVQPFVTAGYTRTFGNGNGRNWGNLA